MLVLDPVVVAVKNLPPWAIALGSVVIATALLAKQSKGKSHVKPRKIHSLGTKLPIFGDMIESLSHLVNRHDWIAATCERFQNEPWQINVPGAPRMIILSEPVTIEAVMAGHPDVFIRGAQQRDLMRDLVGDGIVNSEGERWFHQRKTAAKFFSARTLRLCMTETMNRNINQVYQALDGHCGKGRLVNLTEIFQQFTLQTFLEVGVGIDAPIIGKSEPSAFKAFDQAAVLVTNRRLVPTYLWKLQRWLNVGSEKKIKELMEHVNTYVTQLVNQSLSKTNGEASGQEEKARTAVELFVEHSGDGKTGLHPRDLVDFLMNFIVASRDTSALTTQWFFYELSKHPEVEAKIRAEFAAKLKPLGVGPDGYITADHVKELVYLEAVIKETLRLRPAAPLGTRVTDRDIVIAGDVLIRKGDNIGLSSYSMARNPRVWGPDAAEFKPERWIDAKTGELISFPATKFLTFGVGPRQCIGMKLAMLNLRVLTANVIHRYKFDVDKSNDGTHISSVVLAMERPLLAKIERV
jgi:cytochrome P450